MKPLTFFLNLVITIAVGVFVIWFIGSILLGMGSGHPFPTDMPEVPERAN